MRCRFVVSSVFLFLLHVFSAVGQNPPTAAGRQNPDSANSGRTYSFTVPAAQVWTDTGLDLHPGEIVHVTGGVIDCRAAGTQQREVLPLPSSGPGILLMKVHNDGKPIPATPDGEVGIMDPSHLYLGVNGAHCSGSISAKVQVQKGPGAAPKPQHSQ
ncbi:MAG TPA: hypothetical protein VFA89_14915 [Terriglobales bacterium]|nr:hypothetical protein [Terriglobales bacterium]